VTLEERVRAYTAPFAVVVRARIVLLAARGMTNVGIADLLGVDADTVSKWRKRFVVQGLVGLRDRRRSGRAPHLRGRGRRRGEGDGV
jgi:transposase